MPRRVSILLLLLTLVLAACKPVNQAGTATAAASETPVVTTGPTAVPKQPDTLQVPGQAATVPGCTVVSFLPTPDPTSIFPPVSSDDWSNGPMTATVTIIEYSDFQ
jgi:multidrug efflux pump subunit AcrA (membrane-fusion protein)